MALLGSEGTHPPAVTRSSNDAAVSIASKADEIERLIQGGHPNDAFAAYELIYACLDARYRLASGPHSIPEGEEFRQKIARGITTICGDITPGQIASRRQALNKAASAGIRGSLERLVWEGALGVEIEMADLGQSVEQESLIPAADASAFEQQLLDMSKLGSVRGDPFALSTLQAMSENRGDYLNSVAAAIAADAANRFEKGKPWSPTRAVLDRAKRHLSPDEYQRGEEEGARLIKQAEVFRANGE